MSHRVGIDIGGTFTDFTVFDDATGETDLVHKIPSVPERPLDGIVSGLKHIKQSLNGGEVGYVLHGTTIGVNTLLEGKGASTVLITTRGFRDVYDIGRQWRGHDVYNLFIDRPRMLLPRRNIFEVDERVDALGEVVRPLDVGSVRTAIHAMSDCNVEAVAICLLFSFMNPAHEKAVAALVREAYPDVFVSISSEVNPEYREYERTCTTVTNSYLGPKVGKYGQEIQEKVHSVFPRSQVLIMQSNGGVGTPAMLARRAVQTIMSGPVAGVIGTRYLGELTGLKNLISIDIGGTSCDMSVIPGRILTISEMSIDRHPIRVPQVDISIIGSGGGSIAKLGMGNVLKVGPQSAGASPGPACYGRGGLEPTLTDALLVLGQLNPEYLLAGKMRVYRDLAEKALKERIANPWNMTVLEAAAGVVRVLTAQVAASMRTISVERGYDPREFTLVSFGGVGPSRLLACRRTADPEDSGSSESRKLLRFWYADH
jgi:N-methylhydantoinase A